MERAQHLIAMHEPCTSIGSPQGIERSLITRLSGEHEGSLDWKLHQDLCSSHFMRKSAQVLFTLIWAFRVYFSFGGHLRKRRFLRQLICRSRSNFLPLPSSLPGFVNPPWRGLIIRSGVAYTIRNIPCRAPPRQSGG